MIQRRTNEALDLLMNFELIKSTLLLSDAYIFFIHCVRILEFMFTYSASNIILYACVYIYVWIGKKHEKLRILSMGKDKLFRHQWMKSLEIYVSESKCEQECRIKVCKV